MHALLNYLPSPSLTSSNQCFGHTQPGCFPEASNRYGCKYACVCGSGGGVPSRRRNEAGKEAGGKGDVLTLCRAYGSRLAVHCSAFCSTFMTCTATHRSVVPECLKYPADPGQKLIQGGAMWWEYNYNFFQYNIPSLNLSPQLKYKPLFD